MLYNHYNSTVQVKRLADISGTDKEEYSHQFYLKCRIISVDESSNEDIDGNAGKDYMLYCANCDIQEGDRIIKGSDEYRVVGVMPYEKFLGRDKGMEIRIRKSND